MTAPGGKARTATTIFLFSACLLTILAYTPVLFDFFTGDDFVHLIWLKDAVRNPELIARNFWSNWLDVPTTRFYRPLISVFMVIDYELWGTNGLGFHVTNLVFHLISTISIYLIATSLLRTDRRDTWQDICPYGFFAAAIFGLYPLHPEAVSWITGRVDTIVTAFFLLGLLSYIKFRQEKKPPYLIGSLLFMMLSLASKEMAVTLPPLFVLLELTVFRRPGKLRSGLLYSLPAWALLGAYFILRRLALGTFVGGYDNTLAISDPGHFARTWIHGMKMFLLPVNRDLIESSPVAGEPLALLTLLFGIAITIVLSGAAIKAFMDRSLRPLFLFNLGFMVLSLAPVYKVFAIAGDLQGSRLVYLASVGLSLLCAMIVIRSSESKRIAILELLFASSLLCLCFNALWLNNQVWRQAGLESNAIRAALSDIYREIQGDPQVLLTGLPDNIAGAYVCRNALTGMTRAPQLERDINNCLTVSSVEPVIPFGYLRDSLISAGDQVLIFDWDSRAKHLVRIELEENRAKFPESFLTKPVLLNPEKRETTWKGKPAIELYGPSLDLPGFPISLIAIDLVLEEPAKETVRVDLLYRSKRQERFSEDRAFHSQIEQGEKNASLVFAPRPSPEFALGGRLEALLLASPCLQGARIEKIEIPDETRAIPHISFAGSGYLGSKGFMHLSATGKKSMSLEIDGSAVPGSASTVFEIGLPNRLFTSLNGPRSESRLLKELPAPLAGSLEIDREIFPTAGIYEGRAFCLDEAGRRTGLAGDHIVIAVDD